MKRIWVVVAALLVCRCSSGFDWSIGGTVRDLHSGAAVQGAWAVIRCTGVPAAGYDGSDLEAQDVASTTDAAGRFGLSSLGDGPHLGCTLLVSASGYSTWTGVLTQLCQTPAAGRCKKAQVAVALSP